MRKMCLLGLLLWLVACRPKLDDEAATLKVPATLPPFAVEPTIASAAHRAVELAEEATVSLAKNDIKTAIPLLTEALTIDGSNEDARYLLARTYLAAGRGSTALKLIAPVAEHVKESGWCLEFLQKIKADKAFERLVKSAEGDALLAQVSITPLPYLTWCKDLAALIQNGKLEEIPKYAHPHLPFDMIRSCPECADRARQVPQHRLLTGPLMLVKATSRFDLVRPESAGIPLIIQGEPQCAGRCCSWKTPKSLAESTAALERICLRPTTPTQPTISEFSVQYGSATPRPGAPTLN